MYQGALKDMGGRVEARELHLDMLVTNRSRPNDPVPVELLWLQDERLHDKAAIWRQVSGSILETLDLQLTGGWVEYAIESQDHERERPIETRVDEVAEDDLKLIATWLSPQPGQHSLRSLDTRDMKPLLKQREREAASTYPELKNRVAAIHVSTCQISKALNSCRPFEMGLR